MTKKYLFVILQIFGFFLFLFLVIQAFSIPVLTDPGYLLSNSIGVAALSSFLLLAADIVLPVPSSILMISNGALFGVIGGTLVSVAGGMLSTFLGYWLGKKGERWLMRFLSEEDLAGGKQMLLKYGSVAVILTRPLPLLNETVSVLAGASGMRWRPFAGAAILGYLPVTLIYAVTGKWTTDFDSGAISFIVVIAVAGIFWLTSRTIRKPV